MNQVTVAAAGEVATATYTVSGAAPILWGAAVGLDAPIASDNMAEFVRVNGLGLGWGIHRSYQSLTETTVPAQPAGVLPFRSMKPTPLNIITGASDAVITSWVMSAPPGSYLTIQHEPDNPSKAISASTFDQAFTYFAKLAKSLRSDIHIGPVMMEFQMRTNATYAYCKGIDMSLIDFWGVDTYSDYSEPVRTFEQCVMETARPYFDALRPGLPLVVGETGIHVAAKHAGNGYTVGQAIDRPQWVRDGLTWAASHNTVMCYYDVNTSSNLWKLSDAEWGRFLTL